MRVLDFWAEWAEPSRAIALAIEAVAHKYAGRVKVGKVTVDDYPKLIDQLSVTKLPTIIVINQGSEQLGKLKRPSWFAVVASQCGA